MEYSLYGSRRIPLTAPLAPTAKPFSGIAAGCSLSDTSQVAEPSGSTGHTAIAVDPVYGSQWSSCSIDTTLTAKQGATLTGSYGLAGTGEVSAGTDPSALTGQRDQPADAALQTNIVDDTALTGQSSHYLAAIHARPNGHLPSGYLSPGIHRHPHGVRGIVRVGANASHRAGTAPPLWWNQAVAQPDNGHRN